MNSSGIWRFQIWEPSLNGTIFEFIFREPIAADI
jgi:hypothetical protein